MIKIFTQSDATPSEKTLSIIRQIAYAYNVLKNKSNKQNYSLN